MRSPRFCPGFSTSIEMLLVLRCFVFIGVCVEFVAAVAWLAELFPEAKRRETLLGRLRSLSFPTFPDRIPASDKAPRPNFFRFVEWERESGPQVRTTESGLLVMSLCTDS